MSDLISDLRPYLLQVLDGYGEAVEGTGFVCEQAVVALGILKERLDGPAVQALVARLGDESESVRENVVTALGGFGKRLDGPPLQGIVKHLSGSRREVRWGAAEILKHRY